MRRRRTDWVQWVLLLLTIITAAAHVEHRIAVLEEHLVMQDRDNAELNVRLAAIESALRR